MKNENLPEDAKAGRAEGEGQNISADDLKFMRSVVEKSYRQVKPETHVIIMWGLICMTAYTAIHFLVKPRLFKWITPLYLSLMAIGLCYALLPVDRD